jgi:hypothetical protein
MIMMKEFFKVPCDLYILKEDVKRMEQGDSALGYKTVPEEEKHKYELVSRHAFQPITKEHIVDDNTFDVVFIFK